MKQIKTAYIATKLANHAQHNEVRDRLAELGISLTYDWTEHGSVKDTSESRIIEVAEAERAGVWMADIVIVLLPGGRGTHAELGMAVSQQRTTIIYAPPEVAKGAFSVSKETCAFYWNLNVFRRVTSLESIIEAVKQLQEAWA